MVEKTRGFEGLRGRSPHSRACSTCGALLMMPRAPSLMASRLPACQDPRCEPCKDGVELCGCKLRAECRGDEGFKRRAMCVYWFQGGSVARNGTWKKP